MAKRGDGARESAKNTIIQAFGDFYVCTQDKKIYVNVPDGQGGELIQLAIAMTMPKTPIEGEVTSNDMPADTSTTLSDSDKAKVEDLKRKLGIF